MNISFQKRSGNPSLGIEFFWAITIRAKPPLTLTDHFIPELFYDYFYIRTGEIKCVDKAGQIEFVLRQQTLKTLYTRPLVFRFSTPLVLFGVRLSLKFAESFWKNEFGSNSFLEQNWVNQNVGSLSAFASQVTDYVQAHQVRRNAHPLLLPSFDESGWLGSYSPRHKRRLYKTTFGISRKELQSIRSVHLFLEQTCNFASESPRIIRHINPDVFYDQPHLNHVFKKITGFSPIEYFEASSIFQDNLMAASYNENSVDEDKI